MEFSHFRAPPSTSIELTNRNERPHLISFANKTRRPNEKEEKIQNKAQVKKRAAKESRPKGKREKTLEAAHESRLSTRTAHTGNTHGPAGASGRLSDARHSAFHGAGAGADFGRLAGKKEKRKTSAAAPPPPPSARWPLFGHTLSASQRPRGGAALFRSVRSSQRRRASSRRRRKMRSPLSARHMTMAQLEVVHRCARRPKRTRYEDCCVGTGF